MAMPITNSGIIEYAKSNNMAEVDMTGIALCLYQGLNVGCGKVLHVSTHSKQAQKEWKRVERGNYIIDALKCAYQGGGMSCTGVCEAGAC